MGGSRFGGTFEQVAIAALDVYAVKNVETKVLVTAAGSVTAQPEHLEGAALITRTLSTSSEAAVEEFVFPHLVVITKQTQVDLTALCDVFTDIFKNCDETSTCKLVGSVVFLNQVSLTNVLTALGELNRTNLGEDASGGRFLC